MRVTVCR